MRVVGQVAFMAIWAWGSAAAQFVNFESPHVHPLDLSPNGVTLAVTNTPDNRVEVFDVSTGVPTPIGAVPVGYDPVSVRFRSDTELWVVNQISDTVSIVSLTTMNVAATVDTLDEPADVVFAGSPQRAYLSCSSVDTVQVFDPLNLAAPPTEIAIDGEDPRAMVVSPDGGTVYLAIFESGNGSTLLAGGLVNDQPSVINVVNDPNGPYGGVNPPPNDGANFTPPINPNIPAPPAVGLIVKKDAAGQWMDDNGGNWTDLVSGNNAHLSSRVPGWDVLDNDIAIIDTAANTVTYAERLMNIGMNIGIRPTGPSSHEVTLIGTDCTNEVRFEPNITGVFLRVLMGAVDPDSLGTSTVLDLNPHLDYTTSTIPQNERDQSIGDPRAIVWNAAGTMGYVAGMGSNNVIVIDPAGARQTIAPIEVPEGPTGLALDEANARLYVLSKFAAAVSVINTGTNTVIASTGFYDPSPEAIKIGRRHLYNTRETSGLGQAACASCHVDARMDRLAWDLGDPAGAEKSLDDQNLGFNILSGGFEPFHPMKGPMTTQTMIDIIGKEPHHWRGDRDGLEEFNPAFVFLQGDDEMLSDGEMQEYEDFLATLHFHPNPLRNMDNSLPTDLPLPGQFATGRFALAGGLPRGEALPNGDAERGLRLYMGTEVNRPRMDAQLNCVSCHTLPLGAGGDSTFNFGLNAFVPFPAGPLGEAHQALVSVDGNTNIAFKTPHLRNEIEKAGMTLAHPVSRAGFGLLHDGSVDTVATFVSSNVFSIQNDQDAADLTALMLAFSGSDFGDPPQNPPDFDGIFQLPEEQPSLQTSQDAHAAVGMQTTVDESGAKALDLDRLNAFEALAESGAVDLIAKRGGEGWLRLPGGAYQTNEEAVQTNRADLLATAAPGAAITFTVVPQGSGHRLGIDRDEDNLLDGDETNLGTNPADPDTDNDGFDDGAEVAAGSDPTNAESTPDMPNCCRDGDVDQSGSLTPGDALLAFQHFLTQIQLAQCQQFHADTENPQQPPSITPGDALCIFQHFLQLPSCLDATPFPQPCSQSI